VTHAFWYRFRNTYWLANDPEDYDANTGVLRTTYAAKPAYTALTGVTARQAPSGETATTTVASASTTTVAVATTSTTTARTTTSTTVGLGKSR